MRGDKLTSMSTTAAIPVEKLRPLVHEKIDKLTAEELAAVHRQLELIELKREFDAIRGEIGEDWRAGRITKEKVEEAIREYRAAHPYGS